MSFFAEHVAQVAAEEKEGTADDHSVDPEKEHEDPPRPKLTGAQP